MINLFTYASLLLLALRDDADVADASKISSTHASYDGNVLHLEGNVELEHPLGTMAADGAHLEKQEANKELPFSKILLKQNVAMNLNNHGRLFCEIADLDFVLLKGLLLPKEGEKVRYEDKNNSFQLMSNSAEIRIVKDVDNNKKVDYSIHEMRAMNDVIIHYEKGYVLQADEALYQQAASDQQKPVITAFVNDPSDHCILSHDSDVIHAKLVQFYPSDSKAVLTHPKGHLVSSLLPGVQKNPVEFESNLLVWDHTANTLLLKGNATVSETILGQIHCAEEIEVKQKVENGKPSIQTILTKGMTTLKHVNSLTNLSHTLITYGSLILNDEENKIYINSPKLEKEIPEGQQIYYEQGDVAMHANDACLEYFMDEGHFQPKEVLLTGNVHFASLNPSVSPRCALADQVIYHPLSKEVVLSANSGNKVLYWDKQEGLSVSARQIRITTDELTGKESVKGIGNVRLAFSNAENQTLKKVFPFYHPPLLTYESTHE